MPATSDRVGPMSSSGLCVVRARLLRFEEEADGDAAVEHGLLLIGGAAMLSV